MPSIRSDTEWTVVISKFESFHNFYVQKVDDHRSSSNLKSNYTSAVADKSNGFIQRPHVGSIIETLTDKEDGVWYKGEVMAAHNDTDIIVRILRDGSICKSTKIKDLPENDEKLIYRCYLEEDSENDELTNDPFSFNIISNIMTSQQWIMRTSSDREPYKVTLSLDGEDCFDVICKLLPLPDDEDIAINNLPSSVDDPEDKVALQIEEKPKNCVEKKKGTENGLITPQSETVTVKNFETFKNFQVRSECLCTLHMERINAELKICKTKKSRIVKNKVGSIAVAFDRNADNCYRVLVESITSHGTNCYLMDYGEYDVFKEFYKPTDFLRKCPPMVKRCRLYAPNLAGKEDEIWFADVDDVFKDILSVEGVKFDMVVKEDGNWRDPCVVSLTVDDVDISEMLWPINVRVTHVNSLTDFKIRAISSEQMAVTELLESTNVPMVAVENPVHGALYLAEIESKLIRVKFDSFGGTKYVVIDIDDTLNNLSVHELYEIPEGMSNVPPFAMACSFIFRGDEDAYSLDAFKYLSRENVVFIMTIIAEKDGTKPNLVKLYHDNKDVLSILKL